MGYRAENAGDDGLRSDAEALHAAVSDLVRLYQFRDRDRICCHDISVTQCHALEVLVERGPSRSQALAAALRLDKSTTTRVVDALVRKGYVERRPDPEDARAVTLTATAAGRQLYGLINEDLIDQQALMIRDLDPGVRQAATELISRLARAARDRFDGGGTGSVCGVGRGVPGQGCG